MNHLTFFFFGSSASFYFKSLLYCYGNYSLVLRICYQCKSASVLEYVFFLFFFFQTFSPVFYLKLLCSQLHGTLLFRVSRKVSAVSSQNIFSYVTGPILSYQGTPKEFGQRDGYCRSNMKVTPNTGLLYRVGKNSLHLKDKLLVFSCGCK